MQYPPRAVGSYNRGNWDEQRSDIHQEIQWALGEEPASITFPARHELNEQEHCGTLETTPHVLTSDGWMSLLFGRPVTSRGMACVPVGFGDDLKADLYYPETISEEKKLPLVIWLHPFSYSTGYSRDAQRPFESLINHGFAVLAFDQIGFGTRVRSARGFYERYPSWSLMGKMVADTRAAIDAGVALSLIDPKRVYIIGYALGAKVGLLAAAMDERVKGLAVVAGFDPLRLDTQDKGVEGIWQYSHLHGLMPRFGFFLGHEDRLPLDFDEVLATVAPRPVLVVAPMLDRYARVDDVRREVEEARRVYGHYGHAEALRLETPLEFNRFSQPLQEQVLDWLSVVQ